MMVSVIIPNYNHASFLKQRLDSIFAQTFRDFEVILLDDASTDDSITILNHYRSHPSVAALILNEKNSGSSFLQWRKGVQLARGKYIWIAESDDYSSPDFLETAVKELEQGRDLFYCKSIRVNELGNEFADMNAWYRDLSPTRWLSDFESNGKEEACGVLVWKNTIVNASAVVFRRKEDTEALLSRSGSFRYFGDWLFWLSYVGESSKVCYSITPSNFFRTHSSTTRADKTRSRNPECLLILRKIFTQCTVERKAIAKYFFGEHLDVPPRRRLPENIALFFRLMNVSPVFIPVYLRYILSGRIVRTVPRLN